MGTHPIFESDFDCLTEERVMSSHTILLVQPTRKPEGRTYSDYESVNDCMGGVCKIYEEHLKRLNPSSPQITYDISQLITRFPVIYGFLHTLLFLISLTNWLICL